MIFRYFLSSVLILAFVAVGCGDSGTTAGNGTGDGSGDGSGDDHGDDHGDDDHGGDAALAADACEHMKAGPAHELTATEAMADAPDATVEHERVVVTLVDDGSGDHTGYVTFTAEEEGEFAFFLNQAAGFELQDDTGAAIDAEETWAEVDECEEVFEGYLYDLAADQTVTLKFGPTSLATVSFVPVHAGEEGHGHEEGDGHGHEEGDGHE